VADRIIDPSTFSIPALALELESHAERVAMSYNAYGTSTVFLVRVLTPPAPVGTVVSSEFYEAMYSGHFGSGRFSFKGRIIDEPGRPSPHNFLPDPCAVNVASNTLKSAQLISLHTTFESPSGYVGEPPRMGDLVRVNLQPAAQGPFSLQKAFFDSLEAKKNPTAAVVAANVECSSLLSELWSAETPAASTPVGSLTATMAEVNEAVPSGEMVVSQLSAVAKTKLANLVGLAGHDWAGRHEDEAGTRSNPDTGSRVYRRLRQYYAAMLHSNDDGKYPSVPSAYADAESWIFFPAHENEGKPQHWSAAYISYILFHTMRTYGNPNERWQGSSAHHYYMTEGKGKGWDVYDLASTAGGKIKANIGDILLTIYNDDRVRDTPSSHGDVVYKIEGSKAYLSGGNVSNTVTITRTVDLDNNGCYKADEASRRTPGSDYPYYVVMKYNTRTDDLPPDGS